MKLDKLENIISDSFEIKEKVGPKSDKKLINMVSFLSFIGIFFIWLKSRSWILISLLFIKYFSLNGELISITIDLSSFFM